MDLLEAIESGDLVSATKAAIRAAKDAGQLTNADMASCVAILAVATKIDAQDSYFKALLADSVEHGTRPPSQDNVSLPTFLKYAEALGLTPSGRAKAAPKVATTKSTPAPEPEPTPDAKEADDVEQPSNVRRFRGPLTG